MRKYILLLFVGLFLLSGCGNKEVVCTGEEDLEGENVKAEIVAKLEDDKVDSVSATMIFDSEDSANQMCSIFDLYNSSIENDDYKIDVSCDGTKMTFNNYTELLSLEDDSDSIIGMSRDDFIQAMEEDELSCK